MIYSTHAFADAYIGFSSGFVPADPSTVASNNAQTLANITGSTTSYTYRKAVGIGRAYLGLKVHRHLDLEVGYFGTSKSKINYSNTNGAIDQNLSFKGADLSFIVRPFEKGLFLRAGAHMSQINSEFDNRMVGVTSLSSYQSGTGYLFGLGYRGEITEDLDWQAEYTRMASIAGINGQDFSAFSLGLNAKFK